VIGEFVPFYAVYPLLFADRGVSGAGISLLFAVWSATSFLAEVPTGILADLVSRRLVLGGAAASLAACFLLWTLAQSFAGFAAGFVLWGISTALCSGAWEALLYDQLSRTGAQRAYARISGRAESLCAAAVLVATLLASPLMALGGYRLVGSFSVAVAVLQGLVVLALPGGTAPARERADRFVPTLRSGVGAVRRSPTLRRLTLGITVLVGVCSFDEYLPLLAGEHGASRAQVPVLLGVAVAAQIAGAALAGRADRLGRRWIGGLVAAAAVLIAVGGAARPLAWFLALAVGYGLLNTALTVAQARLQHAVPDAGRATVTSVVSLTSETGVLAVFGCYGLAGGVLSVGATTVLVCVPLLAAGMLARRWLPGRPGLLGEFLVEVGGGIAHPVGVQKHEALVGPEPEQRPEADRAHVHGEHDPASVREVQRIDEHREDQQ
jgi:MFS family permease